MSETLWDFVLGFKHSQLIWMMQRCQPPPSSPPIIHNFRCRSNCHKHALFVQPAQTRLPFDIWLMLSRGTAAGHRKQRTGKTVAAWIVSDSSSCFASISPFRIWVFSLFPAAQNSLTTPNANQHVVHSLEKFSAGENFNSGDTSSELSYICMHMLNDFVDFWIWSWFVLSVNKNMLQRKSFRYYLRILQGQVSFANLPVPWGET